MTVSEKPLAALKKRKLSFRQWQQPKAATGQLGEDQAVKYLTSLHYLIIDRNVLFKSGEIDIVALDESDSELVFIEVKARTHTHFGHPSQAWNWKKRRASHSAAQQYLQASPHLTTRNYRFDLVLILPNTTVHYKNITE